MRDGKDAEGKPVPALIEAKTLKDIGEGDYIPSGMTAMRDGVGDAIDFLAAEAKKADSVLVVVISDGMENASKRFAVARNPSFGCNLQTTWKSHLQ